MPSKMRETAMLKAQNNSGPVSTRIKRTQGNSDGERRNGVARRKGKLVGRQQVGPSNAAQWRMDAFVPIVS